MKDLFKFNDVLASDNVESNTLFAGTGYNDTILTYVLMKAAINHALYDEQPSIIWMGKRDHFSYLIKKLGVKENELYDIYKYLGIKFFESSQIHSLVELIHFFQVSAPELPAGTLIVNCDISNFIISEYFESTYLSLDLEKLRDQLYKDELYDLLQDFEEAHDKEWWDNELATALSEIPAHVPRRTEMARAEVLKKIEKKWEIQQNRLKESVYRRAYEIVESARTKNIQNLKGVYSNHSKKRVERSLEVLSEVANERGYIFYLGLAPLQSETIRRDYQSLSDAVDNFIRILGTSGKDIEGWNKITADRIADEFSAKFISRDNEKEATWHIEQIGGLLP